MRFHSVSKLLLTLLFLAPPGAHAQQLSLDGAWLINSAADVSAQGAVISTPTFIPDNWYQAKVPTTIVAALVAAKVFEDPNFGMNLRSMPGTTYPSGYNFANLPMPPGSPFAKPWWFRRTFELPPQTARKTVTLHFDGINFRANVWLNGHQVAIAKQTAGMWRLFTFDVTTAVLPGPNVLAVEIFPPTPHDLANTFVDWNPMPPDKNMGIWRSVYLDITDSVVIESSQVVSKLDSLDLAHLTVWADLHNYSHQPITGELKGSAASVNFSKTITIPADARLAFQIPVIDIPHPKLWWPIDFGSPHLENLHLEFGTAKSDTRFGIREVTSEQIPQLPAIGAGKNGVPLSNLRFKINGQSILIRGGGYTFDMLLRTDPKRQQAELDYVRDMHLNAIRLEGKIEDDNFFRLADEAGILILAGWSCCDHWEQWKQWDDEDHALADASLRNQITRLRSHPSLLAWLNGSDNPPPSAVEEKYIVILKELRWPNPYISSASSKATKVTGESGVKMLGPYEYVAPAYWSQPNAPGGAYGFNTETSPGPAPPPIESLKRMLGSDHLWPVDSWWSYHAGGGPFRTLTVFNDALANRYGPSANVDDYAMKAQVMAYEGERAMFEAFGRNKDTGATGVIQWMLNNAWPSLIWHLYDYYLRPAGAYFGAKKACEPLHIQYSYHNKSVAVVNSSRDDFKGVSANVDVYSFNLTPLFSKEIHFDIGANRANELFFLPAIANLTSTYFLRLTISRDGLTFSHNFYWLSTQPDIMAFEKSNYYLTPTKTFSDLRALNNLPKVSIRSSMTAEAGGARVTLQNTGASLAFSVRLKLLRGDEEILPVLWEDNYFELMPGEKRVLSVRFNGNEPVTLAVFGWNVTN